MQYRIMWNAGQASSSEAMRNLMSSVENSVNQAIANGFRPLGGISVSRSDQEDDTYLMVAQAVVYEDTILLSK